MKHLVLSLGLKTCTLPAHELDNHPGSLLSELARCKDADGAELEAVASGCCTATPTETVGNISTLRLDSLPSFPFADWPAALDIVPLLYRSKPLPVATLTQVLEQPALNGGDGGGKFKVVYQRLWTLLHFLVLPSKVSDWLPFEDITVSDSVALEFSYFCLAQEAADLIRTFQPDLAAGGGFAWSNTAAFLVRTNAAKPGLTVQLVKVREPAEFQAALAKTVKWQEVFMQPLMSRTSFGSIRCTASDCSIDLGSTHVLQVPISVKEDGTITEKPTLLPNAWASCGTVVGPHAKADNCIGEFHHPGLGRYLAEALKPACGVNLRIVVCTVKAIAHGSGNTYVTRPIPLWVLHWGPQRLVWNLADALAATFASMWQSIINVIRWVDSCVH